jgi:O-antigen ligase
MSVLALLLAPFPAFRWNPGTGFVIKSIFQNPQSLGIIAGAGVWGLVPQTFRGRYRKVAGAGVLICLIVVILAENRSILLGLVGGVVVVFAQRFRGGLASVPVVAIGASCSLVVFGIVFEIIPGPTALATHDLNNRVPLWIASVEAASQGFMSALFGHGARNMSALLEPYIIGRGPSGPHNGYLRMLLNTGIVGLLAYIRIQLAALNNLRAAVSINELAIVGLLITFMIADLFGSITFFGFSTDTFLLAVSTGYALQMSINNNQRDL